MKTTSVRFPADLLDALEEMAASRGYTVSKLLRQLGKAAVQQARPKLVGTAPEHALAPPKAASRKERIMVYVSEEEKVTIERGQQVSGLSESAFVRQAALARATELLRRSGGRAAAV